MLFQKLIFVAFAERVLLLDKECIRCRRFLLFIEAHSVEPSSLFISLLTFKDLFRRPLKILSLKVNLPVINRILVGNIHHLGTLVILKQRSLALLILLLRLQNQIIVQLLPQELA
jgi:hypothetical protein